MALLVVVAGVVAWRGGDGGGGGGGGVSGGVGGGIGGIVAVAVVVLVFVLLLVVWGWRSVVISTCPCSRRRVVVPSRR